MMASTIIKYKGIADIVVAAILTFQPRIIYASSAARAVASWTGLRLTSVEKAPGFNQSIACMVAAVGVGHVVASQCGPAARPPIFAMNLTWAVLGFLACAMPPEWDVGSASLCLSSCNHMVLCIALHFLGASGLGLGRGQAKAA